MAKDLKLSIPHMLNQAQLLREQVIMLNIWQQFFDETLNKMHLCTARDTQTWKDFAGNLIV